MEDTSPQNRYVGALDRRSGVDRRHRRFPSIREMLIYRRRRRPRRAEDRLRIAVMDHYATSIGLALIAVILLSITDAFMTLYLLSHGAVEMNPIMAFFLDISEHAFFWAKYGLTVVSVFIVMLLNYAFRQKFRVSAAGLLGCFALIFSLIVVWEVYLVMRLAN